MPNEVTIRVHYPAPDGARMTLRTDADWERDLAPVAKSRARDRHEFRLTTDQPFVYFKPILSNGAEARWARGENALALTGPKAVKEVFPHFDPDATCSVCNVHTVASSTASTKHDVRIFYPPGYAENTLERYPVLYMQDGQNLFFPNEAFGGQHWKVEETIGVLNSMNVLRKVIVVGVYPADRMREYTAPGYKAYGRFVVEDLKPWVDANYRTMPESEHTAVMGSSLGGVVSFYLGWQYPEVFGMSGCLSSTFGFENDLLARVRAEKRRATRFYLDTGWPRDNFEVTRTMRSLLVGKGWREGRDLLYFAFPEAKHNEEAWAMRAHLPFQWFFGERV